MRSIREGVTQDRTTPRDHSRLRPRARREHECAAAQRSANPLPDASHRPSPRTGEDGEALAARNLGHHLREANQTQTYNAPFGVEDSRGFAHDESS